MSSSATYHTRDQVLVILIFCLITLNEFCSSEYTDRYVPQPYSSAKRPGVPRIYSTAVDRSASDCAYRSTKQPDSTEIDFACSPRRNGHLPRAYFCLGSIQNQIEQRMKRKLPQLIQPTELSVPGE